MNAATIEPISEAASPAVERPADRSFHAVLLAASLGVVVLSVVLEVRDSRQVLIPLTNVPMPDLCTFRRMTGIDCPGCGMTRSFISLGHGNIAAAWSYNPAGLLLYSLVLFQLPYRALQLWRISRGRDELQLGRVGGWAMGIVAMLVMCQWVLSQVGLG